MGKQKDMVRMVGVINGVGHMAAVESQFLKVEEKRIEMKVVQRTF